jgi:hypothetical protein
MNVMQMNSTASVKQIDDGLYDGKKKSVRLHINNNNWKLLFSLWSEACKLPAEYRSEPLPSLENQVIAVEEFIQ